MSTSLRRGLGCAALVVLGAACGGSKAGAGGAQSADAADKAKMQSAKTGPAIVFTGNVPQPVRAISEKVWTTVQRTRHLTAKESTKLTDLDPQALVGVVKSKVGDEVPKDVIRGEGRAYAALGLIPDNYDYEAETYALLEDQLAGLYIPEDKTMYLSSAVEEDEIIPTLSHELVHALQDQYFGIGARMKFKPGESDAIAAIHALAEGDATSGMIDVMRMLAAEEQGVDPMRVPTATSMPDRDPEDLVTGQAQSQSSNSKKGGKLQSTPRFLAVGLLAPYADGMRFVHAMRRRGGWKAVDLAWQKPPVTTEQLMHVEKYDAAEPAVEVPIATANALGAGFTKTYDDVFGEEEGRIAFAEWMDVKSSKKAAAGWGGDHVTLFEKANDRAVVWRIVFDDESEAGEAFALVALGWGRTWGFPALNQTGTTNEELQVWGKVPNAKSDKPEPKDDKAKKPAKPESKGKKGEPPPLPELPEAPGAAPMPAKLNGCRALKQSGKVVTLIAGAPCASIVAWSAEVGK